MSYRENLEKFLKEQGVTGSGEYLIPRKQIFLLGGNPLPVRIALEALHPEEAMIITSRDAESVVPELRLQTRKLGTAIDVLVLNAPREQREITYTTRKAIEKMRSSGHEAPVGLHYTGGTKNMAAHAISTWRLVFEEERKNHVPLHWCTSLDGTKDEIVFDSIAKGYKIRGLIISFEDIIHLHNFEIFKDSNRPLNETLVNQIAEACFINDKMKEYFEALPPIGEVVLKNIDASSLRDYNLTGNIVRVDSARLNHGSNFKKDAIFAAWDFRKLSELCLCIKQDATWHSLLNDLNFKKPENCAKYLSSLWLEDFFFLKLKEKVSDCHFDVELKRRDKKDNIKDFQLDVVFVIEHTPFVVSVTTVDREGLSRHKYLEAAIRAQQLGGDFAHCIIATLIPSNDILSNLWRELQSHWSGPDLFRVLGLDHLKNRKAFTHYDGDREVIQTLDEMIEEWLIGKER